MLIRLLLREHSLLCVLKTSFNTHTLQHSGASECGIVLYEYSVMLMTVRTVTESASHRLGRSTLFTHIHAISQGHLTVVVVRAIER